MLSTLIRVVRRIGAATDQATLRVLAQLLIAADAAVKQYVGRDLEAADYTEYHDGGGRELIANQFPITRLSGTTVDDEDIDYGVWIDPERVYGTDTVQVLDTDFRLVDGGRWGGIRRLRSAVLAGWPSDCGSYGGWPAGDETIRVRYRAGYEEDAVPADLRDAVDQLAALSWGTRNSAGSGSGSVKSERLGQYQVAYFSPSELLTSSSSATTAGVAGDIMGVKSILDRYRMPRFA